MKNVIHWMRSWGADTSACGRIGAFAEAVIAQDLVTCIRCRRIFQADQDRELSGKMVRQAIDIVENGDVDVATGIGQFSAEERNVILWALRAGAG